MRGGTALGLVLCCASAAGCGVSLDGGTPQQTPDGTPQPNPDSTPPPDTMPPPDAMQLGPWGDPKLVNGAGNSAAAEDDGSLSSNTNEIVFAVADPAANNTKDLFYMSRPSPAGVWSTPVKLPFNVTGASDETPRFSADDLTLYFASARTGGPGGLDIYRVTRPVAGVNANWSAPQLVPGVSTTGTDKWFMPCSKNNSYLTILGNDIGEGTLGSAPTVSAALSSSTGTETGTFLSPDCLTAYFASTRSGTNQIYVSTRASLGAPWGTPTLVADFQLLGGQQEDPWVSSDLRTFAFVSNAKGTKDVYISTR